MMKKKDGKPKKKKERFSKHQLVEDENLSQIKECRQSRQKTENKTKTNADVQHGEQKPNARSPEVRRGAVEYEMKYED